MLFVCAEMLWNYENSKGNYSKQGRNCSEAATHKENRLGVTGSLAERVCTQASTHGHLCGLPAIDRRNLPFTPFWPALYAVKQSVCLPLWPPFEQKRASLPAVLIRRSSQQENERQFWAGMRTVGGIMNDHVIPATKGNAAQVFPVEYKQMVWRREVCNRQHTCCNAQHQFSIVIGFAVWSIIFYLTWYLIEWLIVN